MTITESLYQFAQSLLVLALPVIFTYLARSAAAWLNSKAAQIDQQATEQSRDLLHAAARLAVRAAEQMKGPADTKLALATEITQKYLDQHGIQLDAGLLRGIIEDAVYTEFRKPTVYLGMGGVTVTPVSTDNTTSISAHG